MSLICTVFKIWCAFAKVFREWLQNNTICKIYPSPIWFYFPCFHHFRQIFVLSPTSIFASRQSFQNGFSYLNSISSESEFINITFWQLPKLLFTLVLSRTWSYIRSKTPWRIAHSHQIRTTSGSQRVNVSWLCKIWYVLLITLHKLARSTA